MADQTENLELALTSAEDEAIAVINANKTYGWGPRKTTVLNDLCLTVRKASIYALLGPSGCGKTTILSSILGLQGLDSGHIRVWGSIPGTAKSGIPGRRAGYMPQEQALYQDFTIQEMLYLFGLIHGMSAAQIKEQQQNFTRLLDLPESNRKVKTLSGGQQRRVSLSVALLHDPDLLVLDEPTVGVDPILRESIWNYLLELVSRGKTVLITTHYIEEARLANEVGLMQHGRLLVEEAPDTLLTRYNCTSLEDVFLQLCRHLETGKSELLPPVKSKVAGKLIEPKRRLPYLQVHKPNITSLYAITWKGYACLTRNLIALLYYCLLPALVITLSGLTVGVPPQNIPAGIINYEIPDEPICMHHDRCIPFNLSCGVIHQFGNQMISFYPYKDEETAVQAIRQGEIYLALIFPPNYSNDLQDRFWYGANATDAVINGSTMRIAMNQADAHLNFFVNYLMLKTMSDFTAKMLETCHFNPKLGSIPVHFEKPIYGDIEKVTFGHFATPGMIIVLMFSNVIVYASSTYIKEKKAGLLNRLWISGVTVTQLLFSYYVIQIGIVVIQIITSLCVAVFVFNTPFVGSIFWVVTLLFLQTTGGILIGFLISLLVSESLIAVQISVAIFISSFMLSGTVFPLETHPPYMRFVSEFLPNTYAVESLRNIMIRGWTIVHPYVWFGFMTSALWIVGLMALLSFLTLLGRK